MQQGTPPRVAPYWPPNGEQSIRGPRSAVRRKATSHLSGRESMKVTESVLSDYASYD